MLVKIKQLKINEKGESIVSFTSPYGTGDAKWHGTKPLVNNTYDVEIEIEEIFTVDQNICKAKQDEYSIEKEGAYLKINGKIDALPQEGCAIIRLAESIFAIDIKGNIGKEGDYVCLWSGGISFFDIKT